jgi:hypothetical protein
MFIMTLIDYMLITLSLLQFSAICSASIECYINDKITASCKYACVTAFQIDRNNTTNIDCHSISNLLRVQSHSCASDNCPIGWSYKSGHNCFNKPHHSQSIDFIYYVCNSESGCNERWNENVHDKVHELIPSCSDKSRTYAIERDTLEKLTYHTTPVDMLIVIVFCVFVLMTGAALITKHHHKHMKERKLVCVVQGRHQCQYAMKCKSPNQAPKQVTFQRQLTIDCVVPLIEREIGSDNSWGEIQPSTLLVAVSDAHNQNQHSIYENIV